MPTDPTTSCPVEPPPDPTADAQGSQGEVELYWSKPPAAAGLDPAPNGPAEAPGLAGLWIDLGGGD